MAKFATLFFLVASVISLGHALDCYGYNSYTNRPEVLTGKTFCSSFYEVTTGEVTVSGGVRDDVTTAHYKTEYGNGRDCNLEKHRVHEGEQWQEFYSCTCFTNMCNFPFEFSEFVARGKTLAPKINMAKSLW